MTFPCSPFHFRFLARRAFRTKPSVHLGILGDLCTIRPAPPDESDVIYIAVRGKHAFVRTVWSWSLWSGLSG